MGKSGRNRNKGQGPAGKSGAVSAAPASVSLSTFRAGRALDALTPAFVQWFDDGSPGAASIALRALKQVEDVLGLYMDSTAAAEVTGFEPVPLAIAVTEEVVATADASAIGMAEDADSNVPGPADGANATASAATGTALAAPRTDSSVLQLKIMLNGSKPPIWRRVLVPAAMSLPQIHAVIQALFGWLDYHLHEFRTGGFRGPAYASVNPDGEDEISGDASRDEAAATVGELLPAVGSTMTYTYDFGDNWVHGIRVEKILADDDGAQLPRCTAGRGAAPAEDSGGTWGWANIVQAVNDPNHEGHKEYREWLGILPGDTLDPKAFDMDEVNEDRSDLF